MSGDAVQTPGPAAGADSATGDGPGVRPASSGAGAESGRWCRATWTLLVASSVWLVFVVLEWLLSGRWWLWVPLELMPPIAYLVVPVLLLLAVPVVRYVRAALPKVPRRGVVLAALAALVLGLPLVGVNPAAVLRGARRPVAGAVRVFAWNTEYWDQDDDPDRFIRFLVAQRADIYLLQEYLNWNRAAGLNGARPVDDLARLRRAFPGFAIAARGELITLSRFPIVARPSVGPDRAVRADPAASFAEVFDAAKVLRTDLMIGGVRFSAYNVHLPVQVPFAPTSSPLAFIRNREYVRHAQMRGLLADLAANPAPTLVAGDFNTSPAMGDLRGLRGRLRDAVGASSSPLPTSWPADGCCTWWRLDWAFTSVGVRVDRYATRDPAGMSDHRAQRLLISVGSRR